MTTFTFYKSYTITIPSDNYIIISRRGFGPAEYLVIDLNADDLRIYSPYAERGRLSQRKLTPEEVTTIDTIFNSQAYLDVPQQTDTIGFDLEQIEITSKIKGAEKEIHHLLPEDEVVLRIVRLYDELKGGARS